jgi:hypothetical protein
MLGSTSVQDDPTPTINASNGQNISNSPSPTDRPPSLTNPQTPNVYLVSNTAPASTSHNNNSMVMRTKDKSR